MSFAEGRIREYLLSKTSEDQLRIEVRLAQTRVGKFDLVIAAHNEPTGQAGISEVAIERQLAREGLVRIPSASRLPSDEFERIDVAGTPVSKMIIEERR